MNVTLRWDGNESGASGYLIPGSATAVGVEVRTYNEGAEFTVELDPTGAPAEVSETKEEPAKPARVRRVHREYAWSTLVPVAVEFQRLTWHKLRRLRVTELVGNKVRAVETVDLLVIPRWEAQLALLLSVGVFAAAVAWGTWVWKHTSDSDFASSLALAWGTPAAAALVTQVVDRFGGRPRYEPPHLGVFHLLPRALIFVFLLVSAFVVIQRFLVVTHNRTDLTVTTTDGLEIGPRRTVLRFSAPTLTSNEASAAPADSSSEFPWLPTLLSERWVVRCPDRDGVAVPEEWRVTAHPVLGGDCKQSGDVSVSDRKGDRIEIGVPWPKPELPKKYRDLSLAWDEQVSRRHIAAIAWRDRADAHQGLRASLVRLDAPAQRSSVSPVPYLRSDKYMRADVVESPEIVEFRDLVVIDGNANGRAMHGGTIECWFAEENGVATAQGRAVHQDLGIERWVTKGPEGKQSVYTAFPRGTSTLWECNPGDATELQMHYSERGSLDLDQHGVQVLAAKSHRLRVMSKGDLLGVGRCTLDSSKAPVRWERRQVEGSSPSTIVTRVGRTTASEWQGTQTRVAWLCRADGDAPVGGVWDDGNHAIRFGQARSAQEDWPL